MVFGERAVSAIQTYRRRKLPGLRDAEPYRANTNPRIKERIFPRGFYVWTDNIWDDNAWSDPIYFDNPGFDQDVSAPQSGVSRTNK